MKRPTVYTIADACEETGLARNSLLAAADRVGAVFATVGGTRLFTERDLERIRAAAFPPGRPRPKNPRRKQL